MTYILLSQINGLEFPPSLPGGITSEFFRSSIMGYPKRTYDIIYEFMNTENATYP